jgi:hypothetical protein
MMNARSQHDLIRKIRFLTGLNDTFDLVRSQILLMDPLPPINKIFSMAIQYERQFVAPNAGLEVEDKVLANASDSRRPQGRGRGSSNGSSNYGNLRKSNKYCTFCGKENHIVDSCYRKHGFPPNYARNSNANSSVAEDQLDHEDARSSKGTESYSFTKDQYDKLPNLLQSSSAGSSSSTSPQVNVAHHQYSGISCLTYSLSN